MDKTLPLWSSIFSRRECTPPASVRDTSPAKRMRRIVVAESSSRFEKTKKSTAQRMRIAAIPVATGRVLFPLSDRNVFPSMAYSSSNERLKKRLFHIIYRLLVHKFNPFAKDILAFANCLCPIILFKSYIAWNFTICPCKQLDWMVE